MKNNLKTTLLALGSVAAIVAPVAGVVACSGKGDNWDAPAETEKAFDDFTYADLNRKSDETLGEAETSSLNTVSERLSRFLYEKETEASFQAQIDQFKWEIFQIRTNIVQTLNSTQAYKDQIAKVTLTLPAEKITLAKTNETREADSQDHATDITEYTKWAAEVLALSENEAEQDKIIEAAKATEPTDTAAASTKASAFEDLFKEIDDINDKIEFIENSIKNGTTDTDDFKASDYSMILLSMDKIAENEGKIYDDAKNAFINTFGDKAEGQEKWISEERAKKYNGASSRAEAIEIGVQRRIQNSALVSQNISIISSYTREQILWIESDVANGFQFLKDAIKDGFAVAENSMTADMSSRSLTDKVWFYGSQSLIEENRIIKDNWDTSWSPATSGVDNAIYKHILLSATPSPDGETLPWVVPEATIRNMFQYNPFDPNNHVYQSISSLWEDTTKEGPTDHFIRSFSDNGGTKTKGGSLGIMGKGSIGAGFTPGFSLGTLAYSSATPTSGTIYQGLETAFADAYTAVMTSSVTNIQTFNQEFDSILADPDRKAAMLRIVGEKVRDALGATDGRDLVYLEANAASGDTRYLVTSKDGIHFITEAALDKTDTVASQIKEQILLVAEEKSASADQYDLSKFLQKLLTRESLITTKLGETGADEFGKKFEEYLDTLSDEEKSNKTTADYIDDILESLKRTADSEASNLAIEYSAANSAWLLSQFDGGFVDQSTLAPDAIYAAVYVLAGGN